MGNCDSRASNSRPVLGFLTVVENPQFGLFGGYLILNAAGRPIEFHCTAPMKPNRAQEILYGPTLESFLYGEQIGQTLFNQGGITPLLVCTDRKPALAAREFMTTPLVLVVPPEDQIAAEQPDGDCPNFRVNDRDCPNFRANDRDCPNFRANENGTVPLIATGQTPSEGEPGRILRLDRPHRHGPRLVTFQLGRNRLALPERAEEDRQLITEGLAELADSFDLSEPFQRIREAIEEAQQAVR